MTEFPAWMLTLAKLGGAVGILGALLFVVLKMLEKFSVNQQKMIELFITGQQTMLREERQAQVEFVTRQLALQREDSKEERIQYYKSQSEERQREFQTQTELFERMNLQTGLLTDAKHGVLTANETLKRIEGQTLRCPGRDNR